MDEDNGVVLLIVLGGAVIVWYLLKRPPVANGTSVVNKTLNPNAQWDYSGLGAAGPLGAPLKVLQPTVSSVVAKLNKATGGVNMYGPPTPNPDGTYTDPGGCKLTPKGDGTYTRDCGGIGSQWDRSNVKAAGTKVYNSGKGVLNAIGSIF